MDLLGAVDIFHKLAQTALAPTTDQNRIAQENIAFQNHIINVNKNADELLKKTDDAIKAGWIRPEAKSHIQTLKNLAVRATGLMKTAKLSDLKTLFTSIMNTYNLIITQYIDRRYKLAANIGQSLSYIMAYLNSRPADSTVTTTVTI